MPSVMKTLLLNPPSFEKFDGGAGSRWPATREIESYWYPVWLAYPAGMLPGSRLLDGPPHHIKPAEVIQHRPGLRIRGAVYFHGRFRSDLRMARAMKDKKPGIKIAFVGPHVQIKPAESLLASPDIDFVVRGEFDHAVVEFAQGKPLSEIQNASYVKDGKVVHNPSRPLMETKELDELPFATDVYQQNLKIENYNVPFLLNPFVSFYTTRGCPALCTFCLWPQTLSGHTWRTRSVENVAREFRQAHKMFPQAKEFFFDDDTFNIRKDRVLALCKEFKPVGFQWSCTARSHSRLRNAQGHGGCGLPPADRGLRIGRRADPEEHQEGRHHRDGPHLHEELQEGRHSRSRRLHHRACPAKPKKPSKKRSITPRNSTARRSRFPWPTPIPAPNSTTRACAKASLPAKRSPMTAAISFRTCNIPASRREYMVESVNRFYDSYYFRPRVAWRIVREALWDGHERKRLYHEAVDFLKLRADRKKVARRKASRRKRWSPCRRGIARRGQRVSQRMMPSGGPAL